jgi:hypothetical protein
MGNLRKVWGVVLWIVAMGLALMGSRTLLPQLDLGLTVFVLGCVAFAVVGKCMRDYEWPADGQTSGMILMDSVFLVAGIVSIVMITLEAVLDSGQIGAEGRALVTWAYLLWGSLMLYVGIHDGLRLQSLRSSGYVKRRVKVRDNP